MAKHRILVKCVVNYGSEYLLLKKWYDDRIDDPFQWEFADGEVDSENLRNVLQSVL